MSVYLLFDFAGYYPSGGMSDCRAIIRADSDKDALHRAADIIECAPYPGVEDEVVLARLDEDDWTAIFEFQYRRRKSWTVEARTSTIVAALRAAGRGDDTP